MRKLATLFSFSILTLSALQCSAQAWVGKSPYAGAPRTAACGFSIGNYGYIVTGFDSASFKRSMFKYDPALDSWSQVTSLGGTTGSGLGRDMAVCFVVAPNCFVGTGQGSAPYLKDFWMYSSTSDSWTQKANFPGGTRRGGVAFAVNGKGYMGTGQDSLGYKNDFWEYNPSSNTWSQKANFIGSARRLAVGFAIGSKGYIGTGEDGTFKNDFYEYDPASNVWVTKANFPGTPRYGASAMVIGTKGYVGCGYDNLLQNKSDFWEYDPSTNAWTQKPSFYGTPRSNAVAFCVANKGYLGTGYDGVTRDDFWEFDPTLTGISEAGSLWASVFPNPAAEEVHFRLQRSSNYRLRLMDVQGHVVRQTRFAGNEVVLQREDLQNGIYFYDLFDTGDNSSARGKILLVN